MRRRFLASHICVLLAVLSTVFFSVRPAGGQSLETLEDRMGELQEDLDATTREIEELRTEEDALLTRIRELDARIGEIESNNEALLKRVVKRARSLYMGGSVGMLESLLSAEDMGELSDELEYATRVSDTDTSLFVRYSRIADELRVVRKEAEQRADELAQVEESLAERTDELQDRFRDASDDYEALKKELAAAAAREAREETAQTSVSAPVPGGNSAPPPISADGKTCPVDGPNSFIDSWGYPRSGGRTHEGTDIMAAEGTSVVAITDGAITYAGYGSSAGNWLVLSGSDGHDYWYLHNRENIVTGGSVKVGEQIATVGNTGNASGGAPHVHFEYHPGGGGPVNPYPLLVDIC